MRTMKQGRLLGPWMLVGILVLGPTAVFSLTVDPTGSDNAGCGLSPYCKTIQWAVIQSPSGGVIVVNPGTYFENVTIDKDIVINGSGSGLTTVDGGGSGTVFTIQPSVIPHNVTLRGMSIVNGLAVDGGGIYNEGVLTVADSRVANNVAQGGPGDDGRGGGIFSSCDFNPNCSQIFNLKLIKTKIVGNRAKGGVGPLDPSCWSGAPGRGIGGGIFSQGRARLDRSSIIGNRAVGGDANPGGGVGGTGIGGGIYSAPDPGGPGPGLVLVVGNSLTPSRVAYNVAVETSSCSCWPGLSDGGGAYADGTIRVRHGIFDSNSATRGGGISSTAYLSGGSSVILNRARIVNNSAVKLQPGLPPDADGGGILFRCGNTPTCTMLILHSTIDGNSASGGGGIFTSGASSGAVRVVRSTLSHNTAELGGGIFSGTGTLRVRSSTLSGNSATGSPSVFFSGRGGAILAAGGYGNINEVDLRYTTIAFNSATNGGAGVFATSGGPGTGTVVKSKNSIIVDNTLEDCLFVGTAELKAFPMNLDSDGTCFAYAGTNFYPPAGPLLVADDPLGPYGGPTYTLRLKTGSPALDTAVGFCSGTDQRGMMRPAGPACDLGSFEVQ